MEIEPCCKDCESFEPTDEVCINVFEGKWFGLGRGPLQKASGCAGFVKGRYKG
jgi:hypothetical protein